MHGVYLAPFAGLVLLAAPALAQAPAAGKLPAAMIPLPERTIVKPVLDCAALAKLEVTDIPGAPVRIPFGEVELCDAGELHRHRLRGTAGSI
jgi:hypothetical protein